MKKVSKKDARVVNKHPGANEVPCILCRTKSGQEYLIAPDPATDNHILWLKTKDKYTELAIADSPNDLYPLIDWLS